MENPQLVAIIVQSGSLGICILLLMFGWRITKLFNKTLNNHLEHTYEATKERIETEKKLTKAITQLSESVRGCPYNKLNK